MQADIAQRIDAVLPQTQCGRCGHAACRPYADAVANGEAIDRCPPGGEAVIVALAQITGRPAVKVEPAIGRARPLERAVIDERSCIGCTLCIQACPVEAIVGASKRMHTVLAALCTGCELCVPPCPIDCIAMVPAGRKWSTADADAARERHAARNRRTVDAIAKAAGRERVAPASAAAPICSLSREERRAAATAALERARARRRAA